jgi:carbohydrate kinase (thermoresistant glucokinase family)
MGVTGVGKSTVAERVSAALGLEMAEGDDFHPLSNVTKMSAGTPLTDEDRWPWLESLAEWTRQRHEAGVSTVLTCSALRRTYRDVLREADPETFFVLLSGSEVVLAERMQGREHFMPISLLRSQIATLEPLEPDEHGEVVDVARSLDEVVDAVLNAIPPE